MWTIGKENSLKKIEKNWDSYNMLIEWVIQILKDWLGSQLFGVQILYISNLKHNIWYQENNS